MAELCYRDKDGKLCDATLHNDILAGDHDDATEVSRELLRKRGWSAADIADFLGEASGASARSKRSAARAARLAAIAWEESKHPRGPSAPGHSGGEFTEKGGGDGGGAKAEPKRNGKGGKAKPSADKPSIENADKIKAAWVAASPHTSVDSLVEHASKDQDELVALAQGVAKETGTVLHNPGVKKRARIEEKLKLSGRKPQSIPDAVRIGFEVSTPEQSEAIVNRLKQKYLVADEGWQAKDVGYFDRKVTVRFADGMMGEVQLWPTIMFRAKQNGGHELYEKARTMPNGPAKAKVMDEMRQHYQSVDVPAAWREELGKFGK